MLLKKQNIIVDFTQNHSHKYIKRCITSFLSNNIYLFAPIALREQIIETIKSCNDNYIIRQEIKPPSIVVTYIISIDSKFGF